MKAIIQRIRTAAMFAVLFVLGLASTAWAEITKTNPVTGATESYTYKFIGKDSVWNNAANWQDSNGSNPSAVPAASGSNTWVPILFDQAEGQSIAIGAALSVEGWNLRMGLYNGASVTLKNLQKLQGGVGMWITVDSSSHCTIEAMANKKLANANPLCLYSANEGGIAWTQELSSSGNGSGDTAMPFHYYLAGNGTVAYNGGIAAAAGGAHVIKQADVTLSGTSQVVPKPLVSFSSSSTTFTADAAIKVYGTDGTTLATTVNLATVNTTGTTTLTTSDPVGTVELVQTSTGVVLYYVDGDPVDVNVEEKTYKPSININFTNGAGNGLTTSADVGLDGYAVPGTSWNNFVVANNATFNTVNAIDSTGAASVASGVSVSISGTRGHWNCSNLTPASNPLHGYIDESTDYPTPTVTITGIPYEHYRVIVYHSTDTANAQFGYDTINGFNFTYVDGVQQTGTTSWGSAGASNSAEAIAEGVNTLVSAVLTGDTVTMVAHRIGGSYPSARGCFAAIQVVEYVPEVSENDLEIAVDGATSYSVDEAKTLSGTVYLTGSGTLTLTGSEKITAATIDVGKDVVLNINADRLDATTFTGSGTVVYDTTAPVTGKGWAAIGWSGTVWVKNQAVSNFNGNYFGNATSTIRFTGVTGYLSRKTSDNVTQSVPIELVDDGSTVAFHYNNGWGGSVVSISTLKGTGTLKTSSAGNGEIIYIANADGFTGSFDLAHKKVQLGGSEPSGNDQYWNGRLYIPSGVTATQAAGTTWSANNSIDIAGTLYANGTLASSHASQAVIGSGTVVFTGRAPTPTGNTWWKNSTWTGTVQMKDVTDLVGGTNWTGTNFLPNDYGNTGSTLELYNCSGWLPNDSNYQCTVPLKVTGTLTINNGVSDSKFVVSSLSGSGTIYTDFNTATITIQVLEAENFTGYVKLNSKRVVFGDTLPSEFTAGQIYIGEGFTLTAPNSALAWWAQGGITLAGELKAAALSNFGDDTNITTSDNGVFTLLTASQIDDQSTSYARITGTGTLRYADGGANNWRTLSQTDFPTGMICENNLSAGLILKTAGGNHTIGSLAGSGKVRSDWGNGDRNLRIIQAKDTIYSGLFDTNDRVGTVTVAPGASTAGTLTLSGTQTASNGLTVESGAAVNLTGTWVGATTVAGTFGGTGTLTGNLTFSDGATFKAFASDENGLAVSGTVTCPVEGTVTVDVSALEQTGTKVLMTASGLDVSKFALASGQSGTLSVADGALKVSFTTYVAEYNGVQYATVQEAIDAAEQAGQTYAAVTILDATAECPTGYYVDTEHNNVLTKYQAAIVKMDESKVYFKTPQLAFDDIAANANLITYMQGYVCVEVYSGTDVAISINASATIWAMGVPVKIRCLNSATVSVTTTATESTLTAGTADENGIVTYSSTPVATTYVWAGTAGTAANWSSPAKWKVGSAEGATASRAPGSTDTVVFSNGASVSGVSGISVAALQVSGTVTFTGGGSLTSASAITLGANDSIEITGTLSPVPTTSVASSYVKETGDTTKTYAVDAYNTVTITGATATRTDGLGDAIKDGDTITFTLDAGEGYAVDTVTASSGDVTESNGVYSYTVTQDATITVTTVSTSLTIGEASFDYNATYATAKTVTAPVTGHVVDGTTFTMTVGENNYTGTYENGVVTFSDVTVGGLGTTTSYTITATDGSTGTTGAQSATVGNAVDGSTWMKADANTATVGTWKNENDVTVDLTYTDGVAALSGTNIYTAAWTSTGEVVTVTTSVSFGSPADSALTVDADAQAAIRIGTENGANVFQVYAGPTPSWGSVYNDTLGAPAGDVTYALTLTLNYAKQTFGVSVGGAGALTNAAGTASFPLAKNASTMQKVSYLGAGTFKSLVGSYVSAGYSADVGTEGNATNVVVAQSFVSDYLSSVSASEISTYLNPNATSGVAIANNGLNYFTSYALGLDPTKEEDKPIVDVTVEDGKYVFTVKHPVYNEQGEITGYEEINAADNVSTTVKLKYGTDAASVATAESSPADGISPAEMFSQAGLNGSNVIYYKAEVTISAK